MSIHADAGLNSLPPVIEGLTTKSDHTIRLHSNKYLIILILSFYFNQTLFQLIDVAYVCLVAVQRLQLLRGAVKMF